MGLPYVTEAKLEKAINEVKGSKEPSSGGTKLYKHSFVINYNSGPGVDYIIINTSSTPFVGSDFYGDSSSLILNFKDMISIHDLTGRYLPLAESNYGIKSLNCIDITTNTKYGLTSVPSITDIVTEL